MARKLKHYLTTVLLLALPLAVWSATSENYEIVADSLNFLGGTSSSETYLLDTTGGELATGTSTSASYDLDAGYRPMIDDGGLIVDIPTSVSFEQVDLAVGGTRSDDLSWSITSPTGYTVDLRSTTNPTLQSSNSVLVINDADSEELVELEETLDAFWFLPASPALVSDYTSRSCGADLEINAGGFKCWSGFTTTNRTIVSNSGAATSQDFSLRLTITILAQDQSGSHDTGDYSGTVLATITAL